MALAMLRTSVSRLVRPSATMAVRASHDGSIRDAGGKWKEKEMADENQYFRKLQAQQLKELLEHHHEEIKVLEDEIKRLEKKRDDHLDKIHKISPKKK